MQPGVRWRVASDDGWTGGRAHQHSCGRRLTVGTMCLHPWTLQNFIHSTQHIAGNAGTRSAACGPLEARCMHAAQSIVAVLGCCPRGGCQASHLLCTEGFTSTAGLAGVSECCLTQLLSRLAGQPWQPHRPADHMHPYLGLEGRLCPALNHHSRFVLDCQDCLRLAAGFNLHPMVFTCTLRAAAILPRAVMRPVCRPISFCSFARMLGLCRVGSTMAGCFVVQALLFVSTAGCMLGIIGLCRSAALVFCSAKRGQLSAEASFLCTSH